MMSIVKSDPPQTYSRLFRPWDVKSAKDHSSQPDLTFNESVQRLAGRFRTNDIKVDHSVYEKSFSPECLPFESIPDALSCYAYESTYGPLLGVPASPECYYSSSVSVPILAMESADVCKAMEQEYLRVLAEDAHSKAANARKQRPKKFKCMHCNVAFSNNGQLKGHIRIHTGERPFKCDHSTCGKTFTRNEELTRHKRIHTGLRPFGCTVCGKKFGRRDHLKKHMKTHIPQERPLSSAIFIPMYPYLYGY